MREFEQIKNDVFVLKRTNDNIDYVSCIGFHLNYKAKDCESIVIRVVTNVVELLVLSYAHSEVLGFACLLLGSL